jgi:hypothetical protein
MKSSPFYPSKPWPITKIPNHPAFALLRKSSEDDDAASAVFYDIAAFAAKVTEDPDRYQSGIQLSEFANLCRSAKSYEGALNQLVRMNVIRVDTESGDARMVPCMSLEVTETAQERRATGYYLSERVIDIIKTNALKRGITMSRAVEAAILAYYADSEA